MQSILDKVASLLIEQKKVGKIIGRWAGTQFHAETDKLAHDLIIKELKEFDASIPIISEEDTVHIEAGDGVFWLVDPIDGTASYAEGFDGYVSQIALVENYTPVVAAVIAPQTQEYFFAEKGKGSFKKGKRLICQSNSDITLIDNSPKAAGMASNVYEQISGKRYVESGSLGLKLCRIADGTADVFFKDVIVRDWDIAPGQLIIHEAGGFVSDQLGKPINFYGCGKINGIIATSSIELFQSCNALINN